MNTTVFVLLSMGVVNGPLLAQIPGTVITFDVPGAGSGEQQGTFPARINSYGDVAGNYKDSQGVPRAFIRYASGEIVTFEAPGALDRSDGGTAALGINDAGVVVGYFITDQLVRRGFIRLPQGPVTPFDAPGVQVPSGGTVVVNINSAGVVLGNVTQTEYITTCFLRNPDGTFVICDGPGTSYTDGRALNSFSVIAGEFYLESGAPAFIRTRSGTTDVFTIGSSVTVEPESINDSGDIVGSSATSTQVSNLGFLRQAGGKITPLVLPAQAGGEVVFGSATSINNSGAIVGYYETQITSGAFLRTPDGEIYPFQIPGGSDTYPDAISETNAITGFYCPNPCTGASRGFIVIP